MKVRTPNTNIGTGSIRESFIKDGAVTRDKIADGSINAAKIEDGTVIAQELASDSVTTIKILDGAVTEAKIGAYVVTDGKLASDSVITAKILDLNVTEAKLDSGSVTETKIADDAVTLAKLNTTGAADNQIMVYDAATTSVVWENPATQYSDADAVDAIEAVSILNFTNTNVDLVFNPAGYLYIDSPMIWTGEESGFRFDEHQIYAWGVPVPTLTFGGPGSPNAGILFDSPIEFSNATHGSSTGVDFDCPVTFENGNAITPSTQLGWNWNAATSSMVQVKSKGGTPLALVREGGLSSGGSVSNYQRELNEDISNANGSMNGTNCSLNFLIADEVSAKFVGANYVKMTNVTTGGSAGSSYVDAYNGEYTLTVYNKTSGNNEVGNNCLTTQTAFTEVANELRVVNKPSGGNTLLSGVYLTYTGPESGTSEPTAKIRLHKQDTATTNNVTETTDVITLETDRVSYNVPSKLFVSATDPSGGEAGDLYFNNSANPGKVKVYNGTAWENLH